MTRLALLPDQDFVAEVQRLDKEITDIKNKQFMGFDITTIKRNETANASDKTVAGSGSGVMSVEFTADHEQYPAAQIRFSVYRTSIGNLADPTSYSLLIQDATFDAVGQNSFVVNIDNFIAGNLILKAYVLSTDTGEVVVS